MTPKTQYAQSDGASIAFQVVGEGPDLLLASGLVSHIDEYWEIPPIAAFLTRLASYCRLTLFDKRGIGLSDPVMDVPTLEERVEDAMAVMDAAHAARATIFGISEGGVTGLMMAASQPQRVRSLALFGGFAHIPRREYVDQFVAAAQSHWGSGLLYDLLFSPETRSPALLERYVRFERMAASPAMAVKGFEVLAELDVRDVLGAVHVPTLVMHRRDDRLASATLGRRVADGIEGARFLELDGGDHLPYFGDPEPVHAALEQLVTGTRPRTAPDRVLATVLFTDIVSSTERAAELGDAAWRDVLRGHDALVRRQLEREGGREIKRTGDGFLATFNGPARALRCARAVTEGVRGLDLEVRTGVHTGECEVIDQDIAGMAVHIAARVMAQAGPGEVLVSGTVKDLVVGSGLDFEDRGSAELRGVPGEWRLHALTA